MGSRQTPRKVIAHIRQVWIKAAEPVCGAGLQDGAPDSGWARVAYRPQHEQKHFLSARTLHP